MPLPRRTHIRLTLVAVLLPIAVIGWQANAATGVSVAADQTQDVAANSWSETKDLTEHRSATLASFYADERFDGFVDTWVAAQPSTADYRADCTSAKQTVFLPPFTGWVDEACTSLLGGGEVSRLSAFAPVLTQFLRACRGEDTVRTDPYTATQRETIDDLVERAIKSDCAKIPTLTA